MTESELKERLEERMQDVVETDGGRRLLLKNPLRQQYYFDVKEGQTLLMELSPHDPEIDVETTSAIEYTQYEVTVINISRQCFENLLSGDFLSPYYLNGEIDIQGLQPSWLLLGNLFGINHDIQRE